MTAAVRPLAPGARLRRWGLLQLAGWCRVFKRDQNALRYYQAALAGSPEDPLVLKCIGFVLAQHGRKRDALAYFDRAVASAPGDADAQFDRGFLLQELNDPEGAIAAFHLALASNPDHDRANYGLALSLIALKRLDEAVAPLERNTKLQPMSPYGWYQLARVQFDRGKPDKTQAIIAHLAKFEPKFAAQLARETGLSLPA